MESLFIKYVSALFPVLQTLIEKVNGKRADQMTYLHKDTSILRRVYSPDNKWEADTVDISHVAADYVAIDSPLPLKARDTLIKASGKLPKVGIKKTLKESEINALNVMEAQGGQAAEIRRRLAQDPVACSVGIDERNEYAFLYGLSNGFVAVKDEDTPDALLRLKFAYKDSHKFGVADTTEGLTVDDLKRAIEKADADGNSIIQFWIAKSAYDALRRTRGAKELVATYNGQTYTAGTDLPVPISSRFNEAFEDETGVTFRVINRSVVEEKNGKKKSVKPWNANMVIGVCNTMLGALVYGRLAEQTNPVEGVQYQTIDTYKLISQFSKTDPLREHTTGQAYVLPVIEDPDSIYQIDVTEGQAVDEDAEEEDTTDAYVTVWNAKYQKAGFITALKKYDSSVKANATDATVIKAVNKLNSADEAALKVDVESLKVV